MTKTPYVFQQHAINLGVQRNMFLADSCGLGKKLVCLEVARHIQQSLHLPTLVVSIKQDVWQWQREVALQYPDTNVTIGTVDPIVVPDIDDWWLVMHYEALVRHSRALSRIKFGTIILDEGHYIKSPHAQRSKATKKLKAFRKVVSTGTPINRSPADLWSPLEFLYPSEYAGRLRSFRATHERGFFDFAGNWRVLPGAKDPQALGALLAPFYLARTKDDVAPQLPPNIIKEQILKLTGAQASLYRRIQHSTDIEVPLCDPNPGEARLEAPGGMSVPIQAAGFYGGEGVELGLGPENGAMLYIPSRMVQMLREQQTALDPGLVGSSAASVKLDWIRAWREGNPEEPTIIFTNYRSVAQQLAKDFDAHLVMGGVKLPKEWTKNTIVATLGAGSTALDLGHLRTAIFLDTHWSYLKMEQALNRIHRLSNTHPVQTIYVTAEGTIDELFLQSFQQNWDQYELIRNHAARFRKALHLSLHT